MKIELAGSQDMSGSQSGEQITRKRPMHEGVRHIKLSESENDCVYKKGNNSRS
jgi:hypothetical protein